jgi:hypothetical protein
MSLSLSLILRPTVSRPVCLGIKHPSGAHDQILITVRHLRVCWCGAFSLTRGEICRLQLLLDLASVSLSGPSLLELVTTFYCLRFETSLFVASYDSQGHGGGIQPRLHTGTFWSQCQSQSQSQSQSHIATDGQSVSKSWCRAPSGAHGQILITLWQLRSCFVGRPLWREEGSVFFICCWPLPAQSFLGPSP